ncbi:MAG: hypothetical protein B7Y28_23430 [Polaromonas sp. 16-63-31]|nr:MAG: hypothetical protein B7Y28_23430 [Polaromonas sp. 16-63-31]OZA49649.1 MAG: hypothetical protein B7X88_14660 [Polaromonas sp. 17-63-33]
MLATGWQTRSHVGQRIELLRHDAQCAWANFKPVERLAVKHYQRMAVAATAQRGLDGGGCGHASALAF